LTGDEYIVKILLPKGSFTYYFALQGIKYNCGKKSTVRKNVQMQNLAAHYTGGFGGGKFRRREKEHAGTVSPAAAPSFRFVITLKKSQAALFSFLLF